MKICLKCGGDTKSRLWWVCPSCKFQWCVFADGGVVAYQYDPEQLQYSPQYDLEQWQYSPKACLVVVNWTEL